MMSTVNDVLTLLEARGDSQYGGECVTQIEHALQAATLAQDEGASSELIVAALLHDIGHLLHDLPDDAPDEGVDDRHETSGYRWLQALFPESVTEPVRLHVAAKRYLCAVDAGYVETLSDPSRVSLSLQGGPMTADEIEQFEAHSHAEAAVRLRRWDDTAKVAGLQTPPLAHFAHHLQRAAATDRNAGPAGSVGGLDR